MITFRWGGFPNGGKVKPSKTQHALLHLSKLIFLPNISVRQSSLLVLNVVLNSRKSFSNHSSPSHLLFTLKIDHLPFHRRIVDACIDREIKSTRSIVLEINDEECLPS